MKKVVITMKKTYSRFIIIFLIVIFSLIFSSCEELADNYILNEDGIYVPENPVSVAIILGQRANSMKIPNDAYIQIDRIVQNAVYGGYVCVIIPDGRPAKQEDFLDEGFFITDRRNTTGLSKEIKKRVNVVKEKIRDDNMKATKSESNLLAAIKEAKNALFASYVKHISNKQIVIIDTGISTVGDINFVENYKTEDTYPDIDETIKVLKKEEMLPDLSGVSVTFIGADEGMAKVAEPQFLTTQDGNFIKSLWEQVALESNADSVNFESVAGWNIPNIYTEDADSPFPYVSTAYISNATGISDVWQHLSEPLDDYNLPPAHIEFGLEDRTIGFKPNSAEFESNAQAVNILKPYATPINKYITANPERKIWLVGTTATINPGGDGNVNLGYRRAKRVEEILVKNHKVPKNKLEVIGVGAKFPWHTNEFPNGSFDTIVAQKNRQVWFIDDNKDTKLFSDLMSAYKNKELLPSVITNIRKILN